MSPEEVIKDQIAQVEARLERAYKERDMCIGWLYASIAEGKITQCLTELTKWRAALRALE